MTSLDSTSRFTRILSKADGVPPLWTWPRMVVRVSKPSFFDTSCTERLDYEESKYKPSVVFHYNSTITDLFDLLTCDGLALAIHCSFCDDDNIQTRTTASLLRQTEKIDRERERKRGVIFSVLGTFKLFFWDGAWWEIYIHQSSAQMLLPPIIWGHLWDEHPVSTTGKSGHQSQVPGGTESDLESADAHKIVLLTRGSLEKYFYMYCRI